MPRTTKDDALQAKHLKLPLWIVKAVDRRAESARRSFTQQLTVDLEQLYGSASETPKPARKKKAR